MMGYSAASAKSVIKKMISKYLIIALLVSLSLNGLLIGVSKHYYDARAEAVYSLKEAENTILEQQESRELSDKACVIADSIATSFQKENNQSVEDRDKELSSIQSIPSTPKKVEVTVNDVKSNVAGIDDRLPSSIISVLSSTDNRVQRQTNPNP